MLVEITVSGMIFQENRDNKNERFTVRGVFGLGPGSIRLHAEEQIETIYIRTFMRGIIFSTRGLMDLEMVVIDILLLRRGFLVRIMADRKMESLERFKEEDLQRI